MVDASRTTVPRLQPRPLSRTVRLAGRLAPGVRAVIEQIEPYTAWWDERNQVDVDGDGPLLVAIGDSTALGIGASAPANSFIGVLARQLGDHDGRPWRVVNLSLSGARSADALNRQLPVLERLPADLVVCCVGTNDLVWGSETGRLRDRLRAMVAALPHHTLVGSLAGASIRAQLANRALRDAAVQRALPLVDPWSEPGPSGRARLAGDRFHPNDVGYRLMARAFARPLGLPLDPGYPDDGPTHHPDADTAPGRVPGWSPAHGAPPTGDREPAGPAPDRDLSP